MPAVSPTSLLERTDDDLFKDSTMTFGEHLEELRSSLFKSAIALFVGFLVGMYCADWVVKRIQDPLVAALENYYQTQAAAELSLDLAARAERGETLPAGLMDEATIKELLVKEGLLFEEALIAPYDVLREIQRKDPKLLPDLKLPETDGASQLSREQMVPIMIWRKA